MLSERNFEQLGKSLVESQNGNIDMIYRDGEPFNGSLSYAEIFRRYGWLFEGFQNSSPLVNLTLVNRGPGINSLAFNDGLDISLPWEELPYGEDRHMNTVESGVVDTDSRILVFLGRSKLDLGNPWKVYEYAKYRNTYFALSEVVPGDGNGETERNTVVSLLEDFANNYAKQITNGAKLTLEFKEPRIGNRIKAQAKSIAKEQDISYQKALGLALVESFDNVDLGDQQSLLSSDGFSSDVFRDSWFSILSNVQERDNVRVAISREYTHSASLAVELDGWPMCWISTYGLSFGAWMNNLNEEEYFTGAEVSPTLLPENPLGLDNTHVLMATTGNSVPGDSLSPLGDLGWIRCEGGAYVLPLVQEESLDTRKALIAQGLNQLVELFCKEIS